MFPQLCDLVSEVLLNEYVLLHLCESHQSACELTPTLSPDSGGAHARVHQRLNYLRIWYHLQQKLDQAICSQFHTERSVCREV